MPHRAAVTAIKNMYIPPAIDADRRIAVCITAQAEFRSPYRLRPSLFADVVGCHDGLTISILEGTIHHAMSNHSVGRDYIVVKGRVLTIPVFKGFGSNGGKGIIRPGRAVPSDCPDVT